MPEAPHDSLATRVRSTQSRIIRNTSPLRVTRVVGLTVIAAGFESVSKTKFCMNKWLQPCAEAAQNCKNSVTKGLLCRRRPHRYRSPQIMRH